MLRDKHETPSLIIPFNFKKFIFSTEFLMLLKKIYDYCITVNNVEKEMKLL